MAWEMNAERLFFVGVAACIYYRNSLENNGVHEAEEKSRKPQIAIIEWCFF